MSSDALLTNAQAHCAATFRAEKWRAVSSGVIESAGTTFLLIIAVRYFQSGSNAKALLASAGSIGLLLSPLAVSVIGHLPGAPARWIGRLYTLGGAAFILAACFPVLPLFLICSVIGMVVVSCSIPILTQIYQDHYPEKERGRLFSRTVMIRIVAAALFAQIAGWLADDGHGGVTNGQTRALLATFGLALASAAWCCRWYPVETERRVVQSRNPLFALRYLREDAVFRLAIISWMLMGFANLMMIPLRVEYLANPRFGLSLSVAMIAFLTGVVPNLARLALSPVWGHLFDRLNFFLLRVVINAGFAIGILAFFTGTTTTGLVFGAIIFGISNAGGDVAWSLWVTKVAPPERVADYMSVHTFFTGLRGLVAPFVAFHFVKNYPPHVIGGFATVLIGIASVILIPEIRWRSRHPHAAPLNEEISE